MPTKDGQFTRDEMTRLNAKFEAYEDEKDGDLECEVCGHIVWSLNSHLLMALGDSSGGILGARIKTPLVNYICTNCGNMKFFSAAAWGVTIPTTEDKEQTGEVVEGVSDGD